MIIVTKWARVCVKKYERVAHVEYACTEYGLCKYYLLYTIFKILIGWVTKFTPYICCSYSTWIYIEWKCVNVSVLIFVRGSLPPPLSHCPLWLLTNWFACQTSIKSNLHIYLRVINRSSAPLCFDTLTSTTLASTHVYCSIGYIIRK